MKNAGIKTIVFWGAVWGILEATLGWFMHLMHFKGEALVLYPMGLFCMMMAVRQSGQVSAAVKVAVVAALVKLVNLFMLPAVPVFHVTNPAVAIFLEGLVTWGFCVYMQKRTSVNISGLVLAVVMVFASIVLFRGCQIFMDTYVAYNPSVHKPYDAALFSRWAWHSLVQGLMLAGAVYLVRLVPASVNLSTWTSRLAIPLLFVSILLNLVV